MPTSSSLRPARARRPARIATFLAALVALLAASLPGADARQDAGRFRQRGFQNEDGAVRDLDARGGRRATTQEQSSAAAGRGLLVRFNGFGTPQSVMRADGAALATGLSSGPVAAARQYLRAQRKLFRLSAAEVDALRPIAVAPLGQGTAVVLRQTLGGAHAGRDGLVSLAVSGGSVLYASSSLTPATALTGRTMLSPAQAFVRAAADLGRTVSESDVTVVRHEVEWTILRVKGFAGPQRVRASVLPMYEGNARRAYETLILESESAVAFTHFVDAESGDVLIREGLVDHFEDNPAWSVFPASPPLDYSSTDTRVLWCWESAAPCERALDNAASPLPWDVDPATGTPTNTTNGNNAIAVHNWFSNNPFSVGTETATPSPTRDYVYPWTNQWFEEACNPSTTFTSPERNDIDAARANLFAMHNRMHDWAWHLGFTEATWNLQRDNFGNGGLGNDPEQGNAQAGGVSGGPPTFAARDNANQITGPDGVAPITNMYLWQPIAGAFYAPCVDGDYDMTVIGHEYTHAISNRMVAGPNAGLSGAQAGAMGEAWSDLAAMEYLNEYGFVPVGGENRYAIGPYVTRDGQAGIRNYGMNQSPLNYSDIAYDLVGQQVHADGEIWSASNFDIRQAMNARYGAGSPATQRACADGGAPANTCPGNRRWIQLVFDAWLLMASGAVSMVDARDAMLAADAARFGGANQDLLWNAFARRGLGQFASSAGPNDADPVPSFVSPHSGESNLTFKAVAEGGGPTPAHLYVGRYEARVRPIADTDPATPLGDAVVMVPGTYEFVVRAAGHGHTRFTRTIGAGGGNLVVHIDRNLASAANGATVSGDGTNLAAMIDDTEATNWASLGQPVAGRSVTVRLDPSKKWYQVRRVQVSAMLRPPNPSDPGGDTGVQNRFSALRRFEIWTCEAKHDVDCSDDADFTMVYTSPADAFPSVAPRPRAPELIVRSFDIPKTKATFVRLVVVTNQCTGGPDYQGEQDADPGAISDCSTGSPQGTNVRAAELQVFTK